MQIDITYRFGCAPNLFWWQLQSMTDDEIQKYNDKYIKEYKLIDGEFVMLSDFDKAKVGYDKIAEREKEIWNAAIEAAANVAFKNSVHNAGSYIANEIRNLKK